MSFFEQTSDVSYVCTCGKLKPLYRLYFCRHCFELRCGSCVSSEVDTRYCASCNESLPSNEAWLKKQCCSNCFLCPICESGLTKRVTNAPKTVKDGADPLKVAPGKPESGKLYYLGCPCCQWNTRSVGLPDATSCQWNELENPEVARINELVEYYRSVAHCDKFNREKKNQTGRRTYSHISGVSYATVRKRAGLPSNVGSPFRASEEPMRNIKIESSVPSAAKDDLPENIYTTPIDIMSVTTIGQRLRLPETEPCETKQLHFTRKPLMVKRSLRCRICEHYVIKPEFLPNSIKFKIQLSAYYMIPEVLVKSVASLQAGKPADLVFVIVNPTQYQTSVSFLPLEYEEPKQEPAESDSNSSGRALKVDLTGAVDLPSVDIPVPARDDAAEFDDNTEYDNFNDDPSIVVWRKGNRINVKLRAHPNEDLQVGSDVLIGFTLRHVYTNTVIHQDKKELQKINHAFRLITNIGKTVA